jgi:hypothetical protein
LLCSIVLDCHPLFIGTMSDSSQGEPGAASESQPHSQQSQPRAPSPQPNHTNSSSTNESDPGGAHSSPSHEATSASYSSSGTSTFVSPTRSNRTSSGSVTSLNLHQRLKPEPQTRSQPTIKLGRGGSIVASAKVIGTSVPKPKNLPSLRKENNGIEYGIPIVPERVLASGTWRAQPDPYQHMQAATQAIQASQQQLHASPSSHHHAAHDPPVSSPARKPLDHAAQQQLLEQELGQVKGQMWATEDSDEEMDYSAPVVFADGSTSQTAQQRAEAEKKKRETELAEQRMKEAAERERIRLERAAAQAQLIAQQKAEQESRERARLEAMQANPLKDVLPSTGPAWGGQQHVQATPLLTAQQQELAHERERQEREQKRRHQAALASNPPTVLTRAHNNQNEFQPSGHHSPAHAPAASPSHADMAAMQGMDDVDQQAYMKNLAAKRKQEREAEIARAEAERSERAKQKLAELERKSAEKHAAQPRQLFEPTISTSRESNKFEQSWRHEKGVLEEERSEYDRGYVRAKVPKREPNTALGLAANDLLEQRSLAHQQHPSPASTAQQTQQQRIAIMQRPKGSSDQSGAPTGPHHTITTMGGPSPLHIDPKKSSSPGSARNSAQPSPAATPTAATSRVRTKTGFDTPTTPASTSNKLASKPEPNWRDESRVKQQGSHSRRSSGDAADASAVPPHKKGAPVAGGGVGSKPRIWADDVPTPAAAPSPQKPTGPAHPSGHPAHTITLLGAAVPATNPAATTPTRMATARPLKPGEKPPAISVTAPSTPAAATLESNAVVSPRSMRGRMKGALVAGGFGATGSATSTPSAPTTSAEATAAAYATHTPAATTSASSTPNPATSLRGGRGGLSTRGGRGGVTIGVPATPTTPASTVGTPVVGRGGKAGKRFEPTVASTPVAASSPAPSPTAPPQNSTPEAVFEQRLREKRERDALRKAEKLAKKKQDRAAERAAKHGGATAPASAASGLSASPASTSPVPKHRTAIILDGEEVFLSDYSDEELDAQADENDSSDFQTVLSKRELKEQKVKLEEERRQKEEQQREKDKQAAKIAEQQAATLAKLESVRKQQEELKNKKEADRQSFLREKAAGHHPGVTAPVVATIGSAQIQEKLQALKAKEKAKQSEAAFTNTKDGEGSTPHSASESGKSTPAPSAATPTPTQQTNEHGTHKPLPHTPVPPSPALSGVSSVTQSPAVHPVASNSNSSAPTIANSSASAAVAQVMQALNLNQPQDGQSQLPGGLGATNNMQVGQPPLGLQQPQPNAAALTQQAILANIASNPSLAAALLNPGGLGGPNAFAGMGLGLDPQQQQIARLMALQSMQNQIPPVLTAAQIAQQGQLVGLNAPNINQMIQYNQLVQTYGLSNLLQMAPSLGLSPMAIHQMQLQLQMMQQNVQQQAMRDRMAALTLQQNMQHTMQQNLQFLQLQQQQLQQQAQQQQVPQQQQPSGPSQPTSPTTNTSTPTAQQPTPSTPSAPPAASPSNATTPSTAPAPSPSSGTSTLKSTASVFSPSAAPFYPSSTPVEPAPVSSPVGLPQTTAAQLSKLTPMQLLNLNLPPMQLMALQQYIAGLPQTQETRNQLQMVQQMLALVPAQQPNLFQQQQQFQSLQSNNNFHRAFMQGQQSPNPMMAARLAELLNNLSAVNLNAEDLSSFSATQIMALRQQQQVQIQQQQQMQAQLRQQQAAQLQVQVQSNQVRVNQVGSPLPNSLNATPTLAPLANSANLPPVTPTPASGSALQGTPSARSSFSLGSSSPIPMSANMLTVDANVNVATPTPSVATSTGSPFPAHPSMPLRAGPNSQHTPQQSPHQPTAASPVVQAAPIAHTPAQNTFYMAPLVQSSTTPTPSSEGSSPNAEKSIAEAGAPNVTATDETKPTAVSELASPLFRVAHDDASLIAATLAPTLTNLPPGNSKRGSLLEQEPTGTEDQCTQQ